MKHTELIAALRRAAIVEIDVRGVKLLVRTMTGAETTAFSNAGIAFARGEGEPITDAELLLRHLVDEDGAPIAASVDEFSEWPSPLVAEAAKKLLLVSGFAFPDENPAKN